MIEWISVKDRLPSHLETILAFTPKGQCVCIFVDSIKMNKHYYFCSQETKMHTLNGVTHWRQLPEQPK